MRGGRPGGASQGERGGVGGVGGERSAGSEEREGGGDCGGYEGGH